MRCLRNGMLWLSLLLLSTLAPVAHAQSVSCSGVPAWAASAIYKPGDRMVYQNRLYEARVQIWNTAPTYCPSCGWYSDLGECGSTPPPPPPPTGIACFYENENYGGQSFCANASSGTIDAAWNDRVSSVKVTSGYIVDLFADANYGGRTVSLTANTPSLAASNLDNALSSFRVRVPDGGGSGTLPKHALIGYWHNFTNPSGPTIPIRDISNDYDVIMIAFGDDAGNGRISFTVDPGAGTEAQFIADVAAARAKGKKVVLSLGGQNGTVTLNTATHVANFVDSAEQLMRRYGFDGLDIDLESGAGVIHGAPVQANLVTAIKQLKARIGPSFYLSMAPEHPYVQGGYVAYSSIWGAYLPIIDGLRDDLNILHVQYYNNGGLYSPYSVNALPEGSVDILVGASLMLIEGFRTNGGTGVMFRGLRPDQVAFGLPSGPSSANSGQASQATIANALNCLTRLQNCGSIRPQQAYPTYRGVMTWSINWDRRDGFNFSRPVRTTLNSLP
jgi:chitinase